MHPVSVTERSWPIRRDHDKTKLRDVLLAGAASAPSKEIDKGYFEALRRDVCKRVRK